MNGNPARPVFKLRIEVWPFTPSMQTVVGVGAGFTVRHMLPPASTPVMDVLIVLTIVAISFALAVVSNRLRAPWTPTVLAAVAGATRWATAQSPIEAVVLVVLVVVTLLAMYGLRPAKSPVVAADGEELAVVKAV